MATEALVPPPAQLATPATNADAPESAQKPPPPAKHSWRRKFRKMRFKFDETMHLSNTLIKDEFRAMGTARRLQEQNDQILDLLLDLNETTRVPASHRFDLRDISDREAAMSSLEVEPDPEAIQHKLHELRAEMTNGIITEEEYARKSDQLHSSQTVITNRTLTGLESIVPYTAEAPDPAPEGLVFSEHAHGYMSPTHEEEYLLATDMAVTDPSYDPNLRDGRPLRIAPARPMPTDKDLTLQNPDSVYNWLRKHQPQVFLQDKESQHPENVSEKGSARPTNGPGRGKRPSAAAASTPGPKADHDDEEMGFIPETGTASAKGRRGKQEDDSAYRPKGGSSRPGKRKREDGDPVGKGGRKKNRISGGPVGGA